MNREAGAAPHSWVSLARRTHSVINLMDRLTTFSPLIMTLLTIIPLLTISGFRSLIAYLLSI